VLFVFSTLLWLFAASGNKRLAVLFVFFDTFVAICCPKCHKRRQQTLGVFFSPRFYYYLL
jgi:hypothetical protein